MKFNTILNLARVEDQSVERIRQDRPTIKPDGFLTRFSYRIKISLPIRNCSSIPRTIDISWAVLIWQRESMYVRIEGPDHSPPLGDDLCEFIHEIAL